MTIIFERADFVHGRGLINMDGQLLLISPESQWRPVPWREQVFLQSSEAPRNEEFATIEDAIEYFRNRLRTYLPLALSKERRRGLIESPSLEHYLQGHRRIRYAQVLAAKSIQTRRVVVESTRAHPKYGKYVKVRTFLLVHDELDVTKPGDKVAIVECRPISKRKQHIIVAIHDAAK